MVGGVTSHLADAEGDAVAHADDGELRDRVLLEVLADEFAGAGDGQLVAGGSEVALGHGE